MSRNPYEPPSESVHESETQPSSVSSGKAAYNVITDTVGGVNVRRSDNVFQIKFTLVTILVCALIGILMALTGYFGRDIPWYAGALFAILPGMIIGIFASGIYLMIYRAIRHAQGHHD